MAAVVQSVGNDNGAGATTLVINLAPSTAGNFLGISFCSFTAVTSVIDSASQNWTPYVNSVNNGHVYGFPNTASGVTSVTVTATSGQMLGIAYEVSGITTSSPLDKTSTNSQAATTSFTSNASATTSGADWGIGTAFTFDTSGETYTVGSGWTASSGTGITSGAHGQSGNGTIFVEYQDFPTAGTYAATGTNSTSTTENSSIVLLIEAGAPPPPPPPPPSGPGFGQLIFVTAKEMLKAIDLSTCPKPMGVS